MTVRRVGSEDDDIAVSRSALMLACFRSTLQCVTLFPLTQAERLNSAKKRRQTIFVMRPAIFCCHNLHENHISEDFIRSQLQKNRAMRISQTSPNAFGLVRRIRSVRIAAVSPRRERDPNQPSRRMPP